ncbi:ORF B [Trichoplusia ni TED virus]|uniref:ORF B n=1 Tax=Trichoplusia ni TED virus TaxID=2083181 RepID=Q65353_9VIRU|nr:ORF B [Trichoplusia ni TED virus]AAA92249.1 ORF B [Trichoplusia ni TED virus]
MIPARSSKLVRIPINATDGEVLVEEQMFCNCIVHECVTMVKDGRGYVELENPTPNDVIFYLDQPASAELFNIKCTQVEQSQRVDDVLSRLRTDHLNEEEKANLLRLCSRYSDVFYIDGEALTFTNKIKHRIRTTDEVPVYTKSYRYPFIHRQEVRDQITKMLDQGIIRPSDSAWSSPIWVVPKKIDASGKQKWRLVVDFRKLNEKTIDDKYPIPNISDVLDKLGKCQYFTTLDLASGFYQVEMDPQDISKTAFNVEHGHFEFLRMPMGLKNSPSTFQRVMDNVLRGLQNNICLVYLDDIIVYSTSLQEHLENLERVFQRLRESNFKIQMDKSEFLKLETAYLGHIISRDGIKPNPDKISAIQKYLIPKTPKEIKQFLGLLGYYRKFIPDFARLTKPLTQCLKKGSKVTLSPEYVNAFEHCKTLLTNDPILQYPDFTREFNLTTDASNFAIGAVLSQGPIGSDKPVCYASRTLNESELNYSTIEKELLAIVWATKYFRPYLFGRKFKILTDHKPLQWMMNLKDPNSRMTRWRLRLSEYDFSVVYKKGKSNTNADALSRVEIHTTEIDEIDSVIENIKELSSMINNPSETSRPQRQTENTDEIRQNSTTDTVHTSDEHPILEVPITNEPLNRFHRQIHLTVVGDIKRRPIVTKPFESHTRIAIQLSESNLEQDVISAIKEYVNPKVKTALIINPPLKMYSIIPIIQKTFRSSSLNLVLTKVELENVKEYLRQQDIIRHYHDGKTNHRGINECYLALSKRYYWPRMKDQITKFINECTICGQAKYDRNPIRPQFNIVPPATKPLETVHMDLFTVQNEKYITFIDVFTKYGQAYHLRDGTAISILQALLRFCTHHGLPITIVTDNGTEFSNQLFSEFVRIHKIIHHKTLPHSPSDNGNIERFHSTILEHIRILKLQHKDEPIVNLMPYAIIGYNSSIHSFTKCRPFDLLNGHFDPRDPLDIDLTEHILQQYAQNHRQQMKQVYEIINETSLANRTALIESRNKTRESEVEYIPQQQVFIKNPLASRQKVAPRYTQDTVLADLPIHIYTSKKRGPVAKARLKRVPKGNTLLQDSAATDNTCDASSRDKT